MHVAEKKTTTGKAPALQESAQPFFQPKLAIGPADDPYEREADAVADSVMRMPATNVFSPAISAVQRSVMEAPSQDEEPVQRSVMESHEAVQLSAESHEEEESMQRSGMGTHDAVQHSAMELYGGMQPHAPIQRKCAACEAEEGIAPVQRKCEHCEKEERASVQRKCAACEQEETVMPKRMIQRDIIDCELFSEKSDKEEAVENEEGPAPEAPDTEVQPKRVQRSGDGSQTADPQFESSLNSSKGGGNPLPEETKSFMEDRFDRDFSSVRVHSDSNAASMSNSIQAHAFTHGSDIYFNNGQYAPATDSGKQLLAHELTHVVQQSGSELKRKPVVQRSSFYFAPKQKISGTSIHSGVLPMFNQANTSDLFTEVKIPGANKKDVDKGKTGVADFYKSSLQNATIGIKFGQNHPQNLERDGDFRTDIPNYNHAANSAPRGFDVAPHVRRLDNAPMKIEIGDLKPGYSSESILGQGQVQNYISGIHNTRDDVNDYLKKDPNESDSSTRKQWLVDASPMGHLTIPTDLRYSVGQGLPKVRNMPLAMYREGDKFARVPDVGMTGSLFVYGESNGVWSYEWIPAQATAGGNREVNTLIHRLNSSVIPNLTKSGGLSIAPKRIQRKVIQRKDEKFSDEKWKKEYYTPWKNDANKLLKDKSKVKEAEVLVGLTDVEKRSGSKVNGMSDEQREQGQGLAKARHWKRFGGFYGWLREKFDFIYVKIKNVVDKVKKKVQDFMKKGGGGTPGDWFKAFAMVVFKIFKMVGSWVVTQVMDKLLNSFREGITKNIQLIFLSLLPDDAKKHLAKFCALKEQYGKILDEKEDEIIKWFFGDKLDLLEKISELEKRIEQVADIVTLIKWGIRLLACASPPAIGCLWNLVLEALMYLVAKLMGTCWFTKEVYAPVMSKVKILTDFPTEVAAKVVDEANKVLPVPDGLQTWFAPIKVDTGEFKVDCNENADGASRLTEERKGIIDIVKQPGGEEKLQAALELMNKRGAGPWSLLTKERIEMLKAAIAKASAEDMKAAAGDKSKAIPEGMGELMGDVGEYSDKEKGLIKESKDAKAAKARADAISKEAKELMEHPRAKEALAKPYPSKDQLKQDLEKVNWDNVEDGGVTFGTIEGRMMICMKGDQGTRQGAYIKYYQAEYKGQKMNMVLGLSEVYTMATVKDGEGISYLFTGPDGEHGITFIIFTKAAAGTYFKMGEWNFIGSFF